MMNPCMPSAIVCSSGLCLALTGLKIIFRFTQGGATLTGRLPWAGMSCPVGAFCVTAPVETTGQGVVNTHSAGDVDDKAAFFDWQAGLFA